MDTHEITQEGVTVSKTEVHRTKSHTDPAGGSRLLGLRRRDTVRTHRCRYRGLVLDSTLLGLRSPAGPEFAEIPVHGKQVVLDPFGHTR